MPRLPLALLAALALAAGGAIAGCGSDDDDTAGTPPPPPPAAAASSGDEVKVSMKDIKFVPKAITVKVGQKIVWTNDEAIAHNVTATNGADFASDTINKDGTFEFTPKGPGKIDYVCTIHQGQDGTITVMQ